MIALLPGFRCVAPDLLGLGLSDRLPRLSDHAPERHAGALAGLVEALDLQELILVGQDWGGSFGALLASRVPDRVAGAVFANTVVSMPDHPRRTLFRAAPLALARLVPSRQDATWETLRQGDAWLRSFQGPVSLVWGMRDPILGRALRRHERALPQARPESGSTHLLKPSLKEAPRPLSNPTSGHPSAAMSHSTCA